MFGFYKNNNTHMPDITIYSAHLKIILETVFLYAVPFVIFLLPWINVYIKCIIFAFGIYSISAAVWESWYTITHKIPLFMLSKQGIKPILARGMRVNLNAPLIAWGDIAQICVYKAPVSYAMQNHAEGGFKYIGIKLIDKDKADTGEPVVLQTVETMTPYTHNIDIPLTVAHPFTGGLIKKLTRYHNYYLEHRK